MNYEDGPSEHDQYLGEEDLGTARCYLCVPISERFGDEKAWPERQIVREFVTNTRQDPTVASVLSCGHTII